MPCSDRATAPDRATTAPRRGPMQPRHRATACRRGAVSGHGKAYLEQTNRATDYLARVIAGAED